MLTKTLIFISAVLLYSNTAEESSFFNQYNAFLKHSQIKYRVPIYTESRSPKQRILRMRKLFVEARLKNHQSVVKYDTLFMIESLESETPNSLVQIWDNHNNTYYYYYKISRANKNTIFSDTLNIKINDPQVSKEIDPNLKRIVQAINVTDFKSYNEKNHKLDGTGKRFTVAIRTRGKWRFIDSK